VAHAFDPQRVYQTLSIESVELVAAVSVCAGIYALALVAIRATAVRSSEGSEWRRIAETGIRRILIAVTALSGAAVFVYNGSLAARGIDVPAHTAELLRSISRVTWTGLATAVAILSLAVASALVATFLVRRALRSAERSITRSDWVKDAEHNLPLLFTRLRRGTVRVVWMLIVLLACRVLGLPSGAADTVLWIIGLYVSIAAGLVVIRSTPVIVDTLDGIADRYMRRRGWARHYSQLRPLVPTFRACLEYASWIAVASIVLVQLVPTRDIALWGPRLIEAIGIFLAGRVIVELGRLEIGHRMLPREGLAETERRRRATMVPLVRSAFGYGAYFATAVLVLGALGFNPMPFLAGAGLLGLVVGFGAQSLINDVVSGFFILFENIYLVGDTVEVGAARGIVEAIEFRVTKIRDAEGRLHVIRNGDMKPVVNYSKDYAVAVVGVDVAYDADLPAIFDSLRQAAARLRAQSTDLLSETEIEGITAFGASTMTVRTLTRVRPGRHEAVAAAFRFFIREVLNEKATGTQRQILVGDTRVGSVQF
jgi:small conductance mechanosensitive channel